MHLALEYNTPALTPSVRIRSATSGQPSPPVGRPVNLAQHISTSPAASLMGAVGGINEIAASARNSNQIWKAMSEVLHVHHNHITFTLHLSCLHWWGDMKGGTVFTDLWPLLTSIDVSSAVHGYKHWCFRTIFTFCPDDVFSQNIIWFSELKLVTENSFTFM